MDCFKRSGVRALVHAAVSFPSKCEMGARGGGVYHIRDFDTRRGNAGGGVVGADGGLKLVIPTLRLVVRTSPGFRNYLHSSEASPERSLCGRWGVVKRNG